MGSSAKILYPWVFHNGPPLALADPASDLKFFTSAEDIQRETHLYFTNLFTRQDHPPVPKPWLDTPLIQSICARTSQDPFTWPMLMNVKSLHATLCKGKPR